MRLKIYFFISLILFLAVNTTYFWEGTLGLWAFPVFTVLALAILSMIFWVFYQVYRAIRWKVYDRWQLATLAGVFLLLSLTVAYPAGYLNFDRLEGEDLLFASREGPANCTISLKLKEDHRFSIRNVCFGVTESKGNYTLAGDTVFFSNSSHGRRTGNPYQFGVIKKTIATNNKVLADLVLYKNSTDTMGMVLPITKNSLSNGKNNDTNGRKLLSN